MDFTAYSGKRDFSERKSPPPASPLCLQKPGPLPAFPLSLDPVKGLQSCHVSAREACLLSLLQALHSQPLLPHFKEAPWSPSDVKLEIFSSYSMFHYCDCSLLINRTAFANTQQSWRMAPTPSHSCTHVLLLQNTVQPLGNQSAFGKIWSWVFCQTA